MSVPAEILRQHLGYSEWASQRLVSAAASLSQEELHRDFKHASKSILGTLAHIFAADRIWINRVTATPQATFLDPEKDLRLETLQQEWPLISERWRAFLAAENDDSVQRRIPYQDLKGNAYSTPLWQIVLHVVNHGSHHRGQVSAMLRALGYTPPPIDLIVYYREREK
ncbi:MAG: DinB family protein [Bryobacteraceae bacterium]|nr:DinB family protein [Bryobacteraceae bacterium]MDW8378760.1 DinB family protein [Bryobacterales bacterium]